MASIFEATAGKLVGPTVGTSVTQSTNKSTGVTAQRSIWCDHDEWRCTGCGC